VSSDRPSAGPRLVHETWGDHAALLARSSQLGVASVGLVRPQVVDVATPNNPLQLEHGGRLEQVAVSYEAYGTLDARGGNAVLVCHALTGSAHAAGRHGSGEVPAGGTR
jgi:homoserine acetyltransferase